MKARAGALAATLALTSAFAAALSFAPTAAQAAAQSDNTPTGAAGENASRTFRFDIQSMPLIAALARFSEITGIQIVYPSGDGLKGESSLVAGDLSPERALRTMLDGTGIAFRFVNAQTITLERSALANQARVLSAVKVEGAANNGLPASGLNGSTDVTATEGSGSYTTSALTIGGKTPRSLQEAQQSVSVLTAQRMQDQNLTDLSSALAQMPGVTLIQGQSSTEMQFFSRGYRITAFQFDGGSPMFLGGYGNTSPPDMSLFDHVELLRGSDGLFNGAGQPGGTVNLVRKRPLDHDQVNLTVTAGSWKNYRADLDLTGPVDAAGRFRGRFIAAYEDRDYFYNAAYDHRTVLSGAVETDATPTTLMSVGVDYDRRDTLPWMYGLPRYKDGADLHLPRDTCLCTDWSRWNFETTDLHARVEQRLGDDWQVTLNLSRRSQHSFEKYGAANGGVPTIEEDTGDPFMVGWSYGYQNVQKLADATVSGGFDLFGGRHRVVLGINWQNVDGSGTDLRNEGNLFAYPNRLIDVFTFDPHDFVEPATRPPDIFYLRNGQVQRGAYASLDLQLLPKLRAVGGARYSEYTMSVLGKYIFDDYLDENGDPIPVYNNQRMREPSVLTPYYGLTYEISRTLSAYVSYTDIFASQAEYHYGPPPGGEAIDPSQGRNLEVGLRSELREGRLNASLAAYDISRRNLGAPDPRYESYYNWGNSPTNSTFYCCYLNVAEQTSRGVDLELNGEVLPGWQFSAGYTYNVNEYHRGYELSDGQPVQTLSPKHLLKLWSMVKLPGRFAQVSIGAGVNAQSKGYNAGSACFAYVQNPFGLGCSDYRPYTFAQGSYAVLNSRVEYRFSPAWSAALNIDNLTDKTYYSTVGSADNGNWYGEPRSYLLTVRGRF